MVQRAAIYTRLSVDRDGKKVGIDVQEQKCRQVAALKEWPVGKVYVDRGVSAGKANVKRPQFEQLRQDLRDGRIDAVIVYSFSRGFRQLKEWVGFYEEFVQGRAIPFASATEDFDTSTDMGALIANIVVNLAQLEWKTKQQRVLDWHEDRARKGLPAGGGTRPFGFEADRVTIRESEAALVREAAKRVMKGESLYRVCQDWQARGVPTVTGGEWKTNILKNVLTAPRTAGQRQHNGGDPVKATWRGILTPKQRDGLVEKLDGKKGTHPPGRTYLLTGGIAYCSECKERLVARPRGDGRRSYVCAGGPNFTGCGRIRSMAEPLESFVFGAAYATWSQPEVQERLAPDLSRVGVLSDELRRDAESLERLKHGFYVDGDISREDYLKLRRELEERMAQVEVKLERLGGRSDWRALRERVAAFEARGWEVLTPEEFAASREVVDAVIDRVIVHPAVRGRNTFDPSRVKIVWRNAV